MRVIILLAMVLFVSHEVSWATDAVELKKQIIQISISNMVNEETREQVRTELDGLTEKLSELNPPVSEEQIAKYSPGSWRQIWSDEKDMSPPGAPPRDLSQVYQVVSAEGWGYNFGVRLLNGTDPVTFALAVVASVTGNEQTTEITRAFLRTSGLQLGESVGELAHAIQSGKSLDFIERDAGKFPKGPIGAKGVLTIHFIDEDLKIGTAPNVYDGEVEMFVMKRVDEVEL